jgi:hypothetical protein
MPESDSSASPKNTCPWQTVRALRGQAAVAMFSGAPGASHSASATGPMFSAGVESKVEQTLKEMRQPRRHRAQDCRHMSVVWAGDRSAGTRRRPAMK